MGIRPSPCCLQIRITHEKNLFVFQSDCQFELIVHAEWYKICPHLPDKIEVEYRKEISRVDHPAITKVVCPISWSHIHPIHLALFCLYFYVGCFTHSKISQDVWKDEDEGYGAFVDAQRYEEVFHAGGKKYLGKE